ncbi:23S rRNA (guanosine(2251)-2'-O)-methyltransferase RlmB [Bermanella marisrubri]|uniref:23S rRNA (guanosine-2'-O-)-methyltransferase RlmB n=1 Tax=Bermanella marisrubri TaxID=207949 RepID=Q1N252_9GAMM|nr:23S rRNA (guanosine(2251)-2'-O)-methyltransferase RlmB [Bermanella marisrubri]EAT12312.1 RNA methyltransferase, TrmH family, group 3 [Bermanella marisrubri]QIZ85400.1 23S rRNA (guanosine(2251)-2'-O)-methyltransferase RlmB [Bermanella marisrubri]
MNDEIVFGIHAVKNLLKRSPERVREIFLQKGRDDERLMDIVQLANKNSINLQAVKKTVLDDRAQGNHQGVIARAKPVQSKDENQLLQQLDSLDEPAFLLVLDSVTDPHNLGACLRTADAAGVHGVIAPKDKAVGLTATVSKVACGAAESVPFYQVTNLARTMKELQERGIWLYGTAGEASESVFKTDLKGPIAIVMGAEGKGLRRLTREACDHLINIPMAGDVSSLNVSVATGVCLFEAVRQRQSS